MEVTKEQQAILDDNTLSEDERISKLVEDKVKNGGEDLTDPFAIAAGLYGLYYPKAIQLIDNLSGNAVKRVLKMVLASHLEDTPLRSQTKPEGDLYQICERLMESKAVMMVTTHMKSVEQSLGQEQVVENNQGEQNGKME